MSWSRLLLGLLSPCLLASCTLLQLRDDSQAFYSATVLVGRVATPADWQGPVVVAATTTVAGKIVVAHQVRLHEAGGYELIVPDGRYTLLAFGDRNDNGAPDPDDPAALLSSPIDVVGAGMVTLLDLTLTHGADASVRQALPEQLPPPSSHSTQVGALADLGAPAFSAESGAQAYWSPMESFRRYGGNLYFIEPYDPQRIPVLFVHGAAGSAQDWRPFFERLDRSRYQAWFFQYPSGAALDSMAHLLYWKLLNTQLRYNFERVHIVAHSMGGLVVRRFLLDHGEKFSQLGQFISLSTPWGGEAAAALGVKHSPAVVPSWRDMQPEGIFLKSLFERPLPTGVPHTLLFSHRGGYNLMRPNTDGVVTLASQLRPEAQTGARLVMGFDEDHVSILAAAQVIEQVTRALDIPDTAVAGGRVQVALSFDDDRQSLGGGIPILALVPLDDQGQATAPPILVPVSEQNGERAIGPIAPGVYDARLMAPAFRSFPSRQRINVAAGSLSPLSFQLSPQGVLTGYIGVKSDPITQPAGSYRASQATVQVQRVVLDGPGGQRVLTPRVERDPEVLNAYLDGRDDAVGALFSFVGLAEGEYVLSIVADGYEPHVSRHRVVPGKLAPTPPVLLRAIH